MAFIPIGQSFNANKSLLILEIVVILVRDRDSRILFLFNRVQLLIDFYFEIVIARIDLLRMPDPLN